MRAPRLFARAFALLPVLVLVGCLRLVNEPEEWACASDEDCASGESCTANKCVAVSIPQCTSNAECFGPQQACQNGFCVFVSCTAAAPPPSAQPCDPYVCDGTTGYCRTSCNSDAHCTSFGGLGPATCKVGRCQM